MDALTDRHERLVTLHHRALCRGAERLLDRPDWSLGATAVLLWADGSDRNALVSVGELGRWIEHLGPGLDGFVRRRKQGMDVDGAYAECLALEGEAFLEAWQAIQGKHPLVSHDDLNGFAVLSQQGFGRTPRQLLVVVNWGDRITAFLVSCERLKRERDPMPPSPES